MDCMAAEIARLSDIVKGTELRITKGTDGIKSDDREIGRKDDERRLKRGRVITRKHMEKEQQKA